MAGWCRCKLIPDIIKIKKEIVETVTKVEPQPAAIQQPDVVLLPTPIQPLEATPQPAAIQQPEFTQQSATPEVAQLVINYLGGFKQQVSIVVSYPAHEHLQPDDLAFLQKMMAACMLTLDDVAVINIANQPVAIQLWRLMPAKAVVLFNVTTSAVGIPFYQPDFKVQHWDGAKFMNAPALSIFRGPETPELKALKRELWTGLQKMFLEK